MCGKTMVKSYVVFFNTSEYAAPGSKIRTH